MHNITRWLFMIELDYRKIAELDPLAIDEDILDLPRLNDKNLPLQLARLGSKMVANFYTLGVETPEEGYAALRDFDFLASSLDRANVNPFTRVDGLEGAMLDAGNLAKSVPRSTITTYAGANPTDERRRSFTGSQEENVFLDSLKTSFDELEIAFNAVASLGRTQGVGARIKALDASTEAMKTMIKCMVDVKRVIAPAYFTDHIRPFFDPLTIGGAVYAAAGGGQLQLVAVEKMVYSLNGQNRVSDKLFEENFPYFNGQQRDRVSSFFEKNESSILAQVEEHQLEQDDETAITFALLSLARMIKKFRYPHRKVAMDNFKLRPLGSIGSGSYTPAILSELIDETESQIVHIGAIHDED